MGKLRKIEKCRHHRTTMSHCCWPRAFRLCLFSAWQPKNLTCQALCVVCVLARVFRGKASSHPPVPNRIHFHCKFVPPSSCVCVCIPKRKWILLCYTWPMTTTTEAPDTDTNTVAAAATAATSPNNLQRNVWRFIWLSCNATQCRTPLPSPPALLQSCLSDQCCPQLISV